MPLLYFVLVFVYTSKVIGDGTFERMSNVDFESSSRTSGIAVVDVDQDGELELIVAVLDGPNMVVKFKRETGKYIDIAEDNSDYEILRDTKGMTVSISACDIDGDGIEEIYLHNINDVYVSADDMDKVVPDKLLRYDGRRYVDVFLSPDNIDIAPRHGGHSVTCIDHTGNGRYAFIVTTYAEDGKGVLKMIAMNGSNPHNDVVTGRIKLADISRSVGIDEIIRDGRGILVGPIIGGDSLSDIFITTDNSYFIGSRIFRHASNNVLLRNNGDGTFTDVAEAMGIDDEDENGRSACVADLDSDSYFDLLYVNFLGPSRTFIQADNGENITFMSGTDDEFMTPAPANILLCGFIDNSGRMVVLKGGAEEDNIYRTHNQLFRLPGNDNVTGSHDDVTLTPFAILDTELANIHMKGITAADLNGDGILELFISHRLYYERSFSIYQSEDVDFNWIRIFPLTEHGAPARGSVVTLTLDNYTSRYIIIGGGSGYMCQMEPIAHFGLGEMKAREVIVSWPDGHSVKRFLHSKDNRKTLVVTYNGSINVKQKKKPRVVSSSYLLKPCILNALTFSISIYHFIIQMFG